MKKLAGAVVCTIALTLAGAPVGPRLVAVAEPNDDTPSVARGFEVKWEGEMKRVHLEGDASPRVDLGKVAKRAGAFAIGPLAGLRGEISVLDGVPYVSRVVDGKPVVKNEWDIQAPFLVYGYVSAWKEVPLPASVQSPKNLAAYLSEAARAAGLDIEAPFPFKVRVPGSEIDYHIINNTEEGYHTSRPHSELMVHLKIQKRPVTVFGVYSTKHAGVFTHHGETAHMHVVSDDGNDAGHLDDGTFGDGTKLFLPAP